MHESYGEPTATGYIVNELASSISVFLLNKDVRTAHLAQLLYTDQMVGCRYASG